MRQRTLKKEESYFLPQTIQDSNAYFPIDLYDRLPVTIKKIVSTGKSQQEKDILTLGSITVLSGCLPNMYGLYDSSNVFPNLYSFVDAPAGTGKGALNLLRGLAQPIHMKKLMDSKKAIRDFESNKNKKEVDLSNETSPKQQLLFIPANNSASSFIHTLHCNEGVGILFATEADTLANSLTQDWGNFSDILRCAFHHETVELQRRQNEEYLVIESPRLSTLLTGTPGQLKRLIPSSENGLFSRFLFYSMTSIPEFRNVFGKSTNHPKRVVDEIGQEVFYLHEKLSNLTYQLEWQMSPINQKVFVEYFQRETKKLHAELGDRILASVRRSGLIAFRIAMTLSSVRYLLDEKLNPKEQGTLNPMDVQTGVQIALHGLRHAVLHLANMPDNFEVSMKHIRLKEFANNLPEKFNRAQARKVGNQQNLSEASITRYLVNGPFEKLGHGKYRKTDL